MSLTCGSILQRIAPRCLEGSIAAHQKRVSLWAVSFLGFQGICQMTDAMIARSIVNATVTAAILSAFSVPVAADISKFSKFTSKAAIAVDHSAWDKLLKTYVVPGADGLNRVRYKAFKAVGRTDLKGYIKSLEAVSPTTLSRSEQFAYWANLYNAKTINVVLDAYPVKSIRDISIKGGLLGFLKKSVGAGGPWKAKIMKVEGEQLSLDDIEHGILRAFFKDPRVHYAVNCASVGCPNLQVAAFTGTKLEKMLNAGAKSYVNSPRAFISRNGDIKASSIYQWFQSDFGGSAQGVLRHAAKYAGPKLKSKLAASRQITEYGYNWSLNDVR